MELLKAIENDITAMCISADKNEPEILKTQIGHRIKLIDSWGIPEGARVLELGCGQGETTLALAHCVGGRGFVHGIDKAPQSYGAPVTLGGARERLLSLPVGRRIKIDFDTDVLSRDGFAPDGAFDCAVFSHCSWYFDSPGEFRATVRRVKSFCKTVCFAEWDLRVTDAGQLGHYSAALLQGQYNAYHKEPNSNIKTPFSRNDIVNILTEEGLRIRKETVIDSGELQDGLWEIDVALSEYPGKIADSELLPDGMKFILRSELGLIKEYKKDNKTKSLPAFSIVAE
jgi:SAM-dependent methyltransferase